MLGAIAVQLLEMAETSKSEPSQKLNYRSVKFYISIIASIVIAAIVGYIYFENQHTYNRIVYFHMGASSAVNQNTIEEVVGWSNS